MTQARGAFTQLLRCENPESTYGTDPSSLGAVKLPIEMSAGLQPTQRLIPSETKLGRRDAQKPSIGFMDVGGTVVVPVDQVGIGYWLQGLMNDPTTTLTGSAYQHVFAPNSTIESFTFETGYTDQGLYDKINGVKVGSFRIRCGGDGPLTAEIGLRGSDGTPSGSSVDASPQALSLDKFNQFNAWIKENGSALDGKATSVDLMINNNLDDTIYTVSSGGAYTRSDLPAGFCTVEGTITMLFENWSYQALAQSGTERSLQLCFQTGSFYLDFMINELMYEMTHPSQATQGGIWQPLRFIGYYDDHADANVVTVTLVNTWAAFSGHA